MMFAVLIVINVKFMIIILFRFFCLKVNVFFKIKS